MLPKPAIRKLGIDARARGLARPAKGLGKAALMPNQTRNSSRVPLPAVVQNIESGALQNTKSVMVQDPLVLEENGRRHSQLRGVFVEIRVRMARVWKPFALDAFAPE